MFDPAPVPIRSIDELGNSSFFDGAGVSMTTGSAAWDRVVKYGFWLSMGLVAYRMYRVLRYDEPLLGGDRGVPPAWEGNPDRSNEEYRELLIRHGVNEPPSGWEVVEAQYVMGRDDWYIRVEGDGWYWYDPRDRGWRFLPSAP